MKGSSRVKKAVSQKTSSLVKAADLDKDLRPAMNSFLKSLKSGVETAKKVGEKVGQDTLIRFSLEPAPGDPGYNQWKDAMKMVARLPEGVPTEFRARLWLTLSERYLDSRGVNWPQSERVCFNEWTNPDDDELGLQIVRDLHRTGCSLFCGEDAEENQLMLKRVLLAYARWNKTIGYCQGFNMLAAIILEVMEKSESDALKVMIFMIEGILPECYFTNNLRGLSVDMAVFRDLLKLRLPKLSKHLDNLQKEAREGGSVTSYEPPLTNVFTMQWFLTLFSTCLPRETVLRVWDLILLEGNEVLLRTALAIWKRLEDRILLVSTADEFYCAMGQLSGEILELSTNESNALIKDLVDIAPFPFPEIPDLREKYTYNITPWGQGLAAAKRGLNFLYSDDEVDCDDDDDDDDEDATAPTLAVAATFGIAEIFERKGSPGRTRGAGKAKGSAQPASAMDKDRLTVDISSLKKQYTKLRQRQKQAQIILSGAMTRTNSDNRQTSGPQGPAPVAMNHLLLGKKPLVTSKPRRGPPKGAVPKQPAAPKPSPKASTTTTVPAPPAALHVQQLPTEYTCPQPDILAASGDSQDAVRRPTSSNAATGAAGRQRSSSTRKSSSETVVNTAASTTSKPPPSAAAVEVEEADSDVQEAAISSAPQQSSLDNKDQAVEAAKSSSSTTEVGAASDDDDEEETENACTDIEEIPRDQVPIIKGTVPPPPIDEEDEEQPVLGSGSEHHKQFMEKLMRGFDQEEQEAGSADNGCPENNHTNDDGDDEASASCYAQPDKRLSSRANSEKAIQIIKENSEILDKILRKKGERYSQNDLPLATEGKSANDEDNVKQVPPSQSPPETLPSQTSFDSNSSGPRALGPGRRSVDSAPPGLQQLRQRPSVDSTTSVISASGFSSLNRPRGPANSSSKPITFNPFPTKPRRNREVGRKLGLYASTTAS